MLHYCTSCFEVAPKQSRVCLSTFSELDIISNKVAQNDHNERILGVRACVGVLVYMIAFQYLFLIGFLRVPLDCYLDMTCSLIQRSRMGAWHSRGAPAADPSQDTNCGRSDRQGEGSIILGRVGPCADKVTSVWPTLEDFGSF